MTERRIKRGADVAVMRLSRRRWWMSYGMSGRERWKEEEERKSSRWRVRESIMILL
jgi:hypothetical protein